LPLVFTPSLDDVAQLDDDDVPLFDGGVLDICDWLNAHDVAAAPDPPSSTDAAAAAAATMISHPPAMAAAMHAGDVARSSGLDALRAAIDAAAAAAACHGYTLHVKLEAAHAPGDDVAADAMCDVLNHLLGGARPLTAAARPGCVLLSIDGLAAGSGGGGGGPTEDEMAVAAADVIAGVLKANDKAALLPGSSLLLFTGGEGAASSSKLPGPSPQAATSPLVPGWSNALPPLLRGVAPGAVLLLRRSDDGSSTFSLPIGGDVAQNDVISVHCRAHGITLETVETSDTGAAAALHITLPPHLAQRACCAILLTCQVSDDVTGATSLSRSFACISAHDPAIVAQIRATCAAAITHEHDDATSRRMDDLLRTIGDAFDPSSPLAICIAAATACVHLGWDAALAAMLAMPRLDRCHRGALVVAGMQCMNAGNRMSSRACASALNAAEAQLWQPGAAAAATALLRHASDVEGYFIAECAVEWAIHAAQMQKDDGGATDVLQAMQVLLENRQAAPWMHDGVNEVGPWTAGDGGFAALDAAERARYATFLTVYNHQIWTMVCGLSLLGGFACLKCVWADVLSQPDVHLRDRLEGIGAYKRDMLAQVRLHPFMPAAITDVLHAPWERVMAVARWEAALVLFLRIPADLATVYLLARYLSTRQKRANLLANPALGAWLNLTLRKLTFATSLFYTLQDLLLAWGAHGAAVEWPARMGSIFALGEIIGFHVVLFPPPYYGASWWICFLAYFAVLMFLPRAACGIVLNNYGYALQILTLMWYFPAGGAARRREARMLRLWRQSEGSAAAMTGSKQKQS